MHTFILVFYMGNLDEIASDKNVNLTVHFNDT